jgi:hypothetical protein
LFQTFKLFNRFAQFKPSALFASRRYCFALSFRAEGEKSFPCSAAMQDLSLPLEMTIAVITAASRAREKSLQRHGNDLNALNGLNGLNF